MKHLHEDDALTPDQPGRRGRRSGENTRSPSPLAPEDGDTSAAGRVSPVIPYRIKTPGQVLHDAVGRGDLDQVTRIIEASPDCVDARNERGRTPLHTASQSGRNDIVKLLVSKGANINARSGWNYSPIGFAANSVRPDVVKTLLEAGADLELLTNDGCTPLHYAALKKEKKTRSSILLLLIGGAKSNALNKKGLTVLQSAVSEGRLYNVQTLCAFGADPAFKNPDGKDAFHYAESLDSDLGEELASTLSKWKSPGKQTRKILPELSAFIMEGGELDMGEMLFWASRHGHVSLVECILELCVEENPSIVEYENVIRGWKSLHRAAWAGQSKAVGILIAHGATVDAKTPGQQFTPLQLAAERGRQRTVKVLVDHGADILAENRQGATAFWLAAIGRHEKTLEVLLQHSLQIEDFERHQAAVDQYTRARDRLVELEAGEKLKQDVVRAATPGGGPSTKNDSTTIPPESQDLNVEADEPVPSALPGNVLPAAGDGSFDGNFFSVPSTSFGLSHSDTHQRLLKVWDYFDFKKKYDRPVKVAVLDTGLDVGHPYLKNPRLKGFEYGKPVWADHQEPSQYERIKACADFTSSGQIAGKDEMIDLDGHGTQVAELILRFSPRSELYIARICEGDLNRGTPTRSAPTDSPIKKPQPHIVAKAIDWAVEQKVDIINMSFGFRDSHKEMKEALNRAVHGSKVLVFTAMSNDGNNSRKAAWPARDWNLSIGVHSCDPWGLKTSGFTPRYEAGCLNFMFVGEDVITLWPEAKGGGFRMDYGTSFAAPAVAAMAALILGFARQHMCKKEREDAIAKNSINLEELCELSGMAKVLKCISEEDQMRRYFYIHPSLLWKDLEPSHVEDKSKVKQHAWHVIVDALK